MDRIQWAWHGVVFVKCGLFVNNNLCDGLGYKIVWSFHPKKWLTFLFKMFASKPLPTMVTKFQANSYKVIWPCMVLWIVHKHYTKWLTLNYCIIWFWWWFWKRRKYSSIWDQIFIRNKTLRKHLYKLIMLLTHREF
jgi:hypothetical protein